jgi:hypothetical protein
MHFHWSLDQILDLEHRDRRRWVTEIRRATEKASEATAPSASPDIYSDSYSSESESWFSLQDLV